MNLVVGNPLKHSLSPRLHNFVYGLENIPAVMEKYEEEEIEKIISKIKNEDIFITAVTMPHKESIIEFLDEVDTAGTKIGSINTIINRQGKLFGYNTDLFGLGRALEGIEIKNKKVLILGAGGVTKTVAFLVKENQGEIIIHNRTKEKALELAHKFSGRAQDNFDFLDSESVDIIINCTPLGMEGFMEQLPIPEKYLNKDQVVFDIVYNPRETRLLKIAEAKGARIISGLIMFIEQGLAQIELAYGLTNDREILTEKIWKELTK